MLKIIIWTLLDAKTDEVTFCRVSACKGFECLLLKTAWPPKGYRTWWATSIVARHCRTPCKGGRWTWALVDISIDQKLEVDLGRPQIILEVLDKTLSDDRNPKLTVAMVIGKDKDNCMHRQTTDRGPPYHCTDTAPCQQHSSLFLPLFERAGELDSNKHHFCCIWCAV